MRRLLWFCISIGFLPDRRWFYDLVVRELWRPAAVRDAGQITGWIEIGPGAKPEAINRFRVWWSKMTMWHGEPGR